MAPGTGLERKPRHVSQEIHARANGQPQRHVRDLASRPTEECDPGDFGADGEPRASARTKLVPVELAKIWTGRPNMIDPYRPASKNVAGCAPGVVAATEAATRMTIPQTSAAGRV